VVERNKKERNKDLRRALSICALIPEGEDREEVNGTEEEVMGWSCCGRFCCSRLFGRSFYETGTKTLIINETKRERPNKPVLRSIAS
jgi:hypothetical protein